MKVPDKSFATSHKDFRIKVLHEGFGSRFHMKVSDQGSHKGFGSRFHMKVKGST